MKKYLSIRNRKKSRGVAVIFTLGILGLLTVMALGFASTALLNRKIADNTSSAEYARHIAKNIAFARAKSVVLNNHIANSAYSSGPTSGVSDEDFLHKMDTVLDGVELYRITNDSGTIKIQPGTARWQYVYGPERNTVSNKYPIIGRYAFAIVPVTGRLDPAGNTGSTSVSGRYGFSEKELGFYNLVSDANLATAAESAAGVRLRTFKEFVSAFSNLSADSKKNLLNANYRIQRDPTPEAFWIDGNNDGKKTEDELYLRFNMPTSDTAWNAMTVDKLIGKDDSDADADIKYTGSKNSISFIPWLKYWTYSPTEASHWTTDLMKKQIAANIIQYNRSADKPTVTDKDDAADWLTDPPSYAGIGRHPMLNEIGFLVRVRAEVIPTFISKDDEAGTITYKYTPTYYLTIDAGAELIYPFGPASALKRSRIWFPDIEMQFVLRKFLTSGKSPDPQTTVNDLGNNLIGADGILNSQMLHTDIDRIKITIPGSGDTATTFEKLIETSTAVEPMTGDGYSWTNLALTQDPADWNTSPVYTKATSFWKGNKTGSDQTLRMQIRAITITTKTSIGTAEEIAKAMARRMTIEWDTPFKTPATVVLKYGEAGSEKQRDVARLEQKTLPTNMTNMSPEKVWFVVYEAKDPLVNHYDKDWTVKQEGPKDLDEGKLTTAGYYPGTLLAADGTTESHKNSTVPATLLEDNENGVTEPIALESATDPAWSEDKRLSSSYIRHAPMKSLWELGFISRAEAFKTLNLARTRVFAPGAGYNARGGGTFAQGDANLLDQIKFSDPTDRKYAHGKININARYHKVFEWLFNKDQVTAAGTPVNWYHNLITGTASDPYETSSPVTGDTRKVVCENENCLSVQHSASCSVNDCLAHLLMERSRILPFSNRSDLLLDPSSSDFDKIPGYSDLSSTDQTNLVTVQQKLRNYLLNPGNASTDEAKSKLVREEYAARFMNLLTAEENDLEHVYIIVFAQTIKDIGGAPALVDWNGDGEYSSSAVSIPDDNDQRKKYLKTGFVRKKLDGSNTYEVITPSTGTTPSLTETITTTEVGTYNRGADKITGETKLIVEMRRDAVGKWKVIGYRYVE